MCGLRCSVVVPSCLLVVVGSLLFLDRRSLSVVCCYLL